MACSLGRHSGRLEAEDGSCAWLVMNGGLSGAARTYDFFNLRSKIHTCTDSMCLLGRHHGMSSLRVCMGKKLFVNTRLAVLVDSRVKISLSIKAPVQAMYKTTAYRLWSTD